jgi:hypothetical protein
MLRFFNVFALASPSSNSGGGSIIILMALIAFLWEINEMFIK